MPAAAEWLAVAQKAGSTLPFQPRRRIESFRAARRVLGFPRWPQDVLRHTCASYWYAFERDVGVVSANLGNTPNVLMRHYRQLVETADAEAFWNIRPA